MNDALGFFSIHPCDICGGGPATLHFPGGWLCQECRSPKPVKSIDLDQSRDKLAEPILVKALQEAMALDACVIGSLTRGQLRELIKQEIELHEQQKKEQAMRDSVKPAERTCRKCGAPLLNPDFITCNACLGEQAPTVTEVKHYVQPQKLWPRCEIVYKRADPGVLMCGLIRSGSIT